MHIEVISFRTTRDDHPLLDPLDGLIKGISSGHIALRLVFEDELLFNSYIQDNKNIPYTTYKDSKTGAQQYSVYFSFWPKENMWPAASASTLQEHRFDCQQSADYSPFNYQDSFKSYLQPLEKIVGSSLPYCKEFIQSKITLPPSVILHSSRLGIAFGDKQRMIPNQKIVAAAETYVKNYRFWRSCVIKEQNAEYIWGNQSENYALFKKFSLLAKILMLSTQRDLKNLMFPNIKLSNADFMHKLEPFITFGYPERDVVQIPLVYENSNEAGLQIEPMLQYIKHVADNPEKYPYNVLRTNCASTIYNLLWHGAENSKHPAVKEEFILPWYIRWLGITITPTLIMQHMEKLQVVIHAINHAPMVSNQEEQEESDESKILRFYKQADDYDELPTSRLGIIAQLARGFDDE